MGGCQTRTSLILSHMFPSGQEEYRSGYMMYKSRPSHLATTCNRISATICWLRNTCGNMHNIWRSVGLQALMVCSRSRFAYGAELTIGTVSMH